MEFRLSDSEINTLQSAGPGNFRFVTGGFSKTSTYWKYGAGEKFSSTGAAIGECAGSLDGQYASTSANGQSWGGVGNGLVATDSCGFFSWCTDGIYTYSAHGEEAGDMWIRANTNNGPNPNVPTAAPTAPPTPSDQLTAHQTIVDATVDFEKCFDLATGEPASSSGHEDDFMMMMGGGGCPATGVKFPYNSNTVPHARTWWSESPGSSAAIINKNFGHVTIADALSDDLYYCAHLNDKHCMETSGDRAGKTYFDTASKVGGDWTMILKSDSDTYYKIKYVSELNHKVNFKYSKLGGGPAPSASKFLNPYPTYDEFGKRIMNCGGGSKCCTGGGCKPGMCCQTADGDTRNSISKFCGGNSCLLHAGCESECPF